VWTTCRVRLRTQRRALDGSVHRAPLDTLVGRTTQRPVRTAQRQDETIRRRRVNTAEL